MKLRDMKQGDIAIIVLNGEPIIVIRTWRKIEDSREHTGTFLTCLAPDSQKGCTWSGDVMNIRGDSPIKLLSLGFDPKILDDYHEE